MVRIEPIAPKFHLEVLSAEQVAEIRRGTLHVLEHVGVRFPSERALTVLAEHGARVDWGSQVVRFPPDLVLRAMGRAPRSYTLSGRAEGTDLLLDGSRSYFSTDGCGTQTVDFETGELRASCKEDVAVMARISDALTSIAFYWPVVSAQDYGRLAPLHELDASFNNTSKHVQTETTMGARVAQYAVRMAEAVAGGREAMQARPPLSCLICTIAPLAQDQHGIEAGMVYAEAGIPVGFMSMPNMGSTSPVAVGGALVIASAEIVSALVLMQLVAPGAPVFYSIVSSVMDPRSAAYLNATPGKYLSHLAGVQVAHDWGVPILGGAFGIHHEAPATWELGRDSVYTALLVPLAGADFVVGMGLLKASTILLPEQIIFDDEIYHTHRLMAEGIDTGADGLALDVIATVGPGGHYLSQKHTRRQMRELWLPELSLPAPSLDGTPPPDIRRRARAKFDRILAGHRPEPLEAAVQAELRALLAAAEKELGT